LELGSLCQGYGFSCRDIYAISEKIADHIRNPSSFPEDLFKKTGEDLKQALSSSYVPVNQGIIMNYLNERKKDLDEEIVSEEMRGRDMSIKKQIPIILQEIESGKQRHGNANYVPCEVRA